jgi:AcrR family transcriptional regulator
LKSGRAAASDPAESDGRRRRSLDSRARIVAAMLELIREGEISPGAEQVAGRAQVGLRTVFRHFKDMDSLYREMSAVIEGELRKVAEQPFKTDNWRARVDELIERRSQAFERIAPFKRASEVHRHRSKFLEGDSSRLSQTLREILKNILPPEFSNELLTLETVDLLLSYETWIRLRRDQSLTPKRAREVLLAAVRKVLD